MTRVGLKTKILLAEMLRHSLERGTSFQFEGLGTFVPASNDGFRFIPDGKPRVFVAYVEEDLPQASKLYDAFEAEGFDPWLDKKKLLPGQNWPRAIENAIGSADFFVACFSARSVSKRGMFQSELRFALECAAGMPLDESFFIPVRLDVCLVPSRISKTMQYIDLFPDWNAGFERIITMMSQEHEARTRKRLLLTS